MGKERKSARERRDVYFKLREGTLVRRTPSDLELSTYFRAVDHKDLNAFGVRTLAEIDLNLLKKLPACHTGPQSHNAGFESRVTIVSYAAWRRRAHLIKQLIVAGASPTVSDRSPDGCLDAAGEEALGAMLSRRYGNGVDASTACFIIESVCRMRMVAARDAALGERLPPCTHCGADGLSVSFDPCGCVVCERCVWRSVMQPAERSQEEKETPGAAGVGAKPEIEAEIRLGEVRCPHCRAACPMRGHGVPAAAPTYVGRQVAGPAVAAPADAAVAAPADAAAAAPADAAAAAPADADAATATADAAAAATADAAAAASSREWICECCCYANFGVRATCRNCAALRVVAGRAPPPSLRPLAPLGDDWWEAMLRGRAEQQERRESAMEGAADAASGGAIATGGGGGSGGAGAAGGDAGVVIGGVDASSSSPGSVWVEMAVSKRRSIGKQLTFLLGADVVVRDADVGFGALTEGEEAKAASAAAAEGEEAKAASAAAAGAGAEVGAGGAIASGRQRSAAAQLLMADGLGDGVGSGSLQLVLDRAALHRSDEGSSPALAAENDAVSSTAVGDRVRAFGTLHRTIDNDGTQRWELRATEATLLRPAVIVTHTPRPPREKAGSGSQPAKHKFRGLPPREAAIANMSPLTHEQRCERAVGAASDGDTNRLEALLTLGFDLSAPLDEYGQTALLIAAGHGHLAAVKLLLQHKASPNTVAHGGVTAASAAAAHGHGPVLQELTDAGADVSAAGSEGLSPLEYVLRRAAAAGIGGLAVGTAAGPAVALSASLATGSVSASVISSPSSPASSSSSTSTAGRVPRPVGAPPAQLVRLVPSDADHPGAGACYIDGGVPEAGLCALEALFHRLPIHPRTKCSQALSDRSYFCDAEGWVSRLLNEAYKAGLASAREGAEGEGARMPCEGEAVIQMRFLIYAEAGGGLPPHVDLSRMRRDGKFSKCTSLLYLTDCELGGKTVLLERVNPQPCQVLAAVTPRRGRLLLFPHLCPHRADEVVAEGLPKLLLRGEMV